MLAHSYARTHAVFSIQERLSSFESSRLLFTSTTCAEEWALVTRASGCPKCIQLLQVLLHLISTSLWAKNMEIDPESRPARRGRPKGTTQPDRVQQLSTLRARKARDAEKQRHADALQAVVEEQLRQVRLCEYNVDQCKSE